MKRIDSLINLFNINNYESLTESISNFKATIRLGNKFVLPSSYDLNYLITKINDDLFLHFYKSYNKNEADTITNKDNISKIDPVLQHISSEMDILDDDDIYYLDIIINKKCINNVINIYNIDAFTCWFENLTLISQLKILHTNITSTNKHISFHYLLLDTEFYTDTFSFIKTLGYCPEYNLNRIDYYEKRNLFCTFLDANTHKFLPDDFYIHGKTTNTKLVNIFKKLCVISSLIYICDYSKINEDLNSIEFIINGHKQTIADLERYDYTSQTDYYQIYKWIYSGGNISDKLSLARNMISINLKDKNLLQLQPNVLSSIRSSYEIYLKENVQQYIDAKNKLSGFLIDLSYNANSLVNEFINSFKNSILAFVTFFISVVVINSLSGGGFSDIFTLDIIKITNFILIFSLAYMILTILTFKHHLKSYKNRYEWLKSEYLDLLNENDINNIFKKDKNFNETLKSSNLISIIYTLLWISLIIFAYIYINFFKA